MDELNKPEENPQDYQLKDDDYNQDYNNNDLNDLNDPEDFSEEEPATKKPTSSLVDKLKTMDRMKLKRILIPIGIIVAIFILYQLLGWFSQSKEKPVTAVNQTQTTAAVTETPAASTPTAAPQASAMALQQVDTLAQQTKQNRDELTKINNALSEQQKGLTNLNTSVANLATTVDALTKNINTLIIAKKKPQKTRRVIRRRKIAYHIKAIVSGRAWLEDPQGGTKTVRIGDRINNGKVELISPRRGIVALSTGEIIQYGSNDI